MAGGEPGVVGVNQWWKGTKQGKHTIVNLGGSNQTRMKKGDHIVIRECRLYPHMAARSRSLADTPGGGGYGVPGTVDQRLDEEMYKRSAIAPVRASGSLAAFKAAQLSAV